MNGVKNVVKPMENEIRIMQIMQICQALFEESFLVLFFSFNCIYLIK